MDIIRTKVAAAAAGIAAASVLLSLGAGTAHAGEFDPQPDPPGQSRGFDPQPEPPTRHFDKLNPSPTLNVGPHGAQVSVGR